MVPSLVVMVGISNLLDHRGSLSDGAGQLIAVDTATRSTTHVGGDGWSDEGITGYVRTSAAPGYTALYRLNLRSGGHFLTTNASERASSR